jgi:hypothetical protein
MRYLGVGLSRTGTLTLCRALNVLKIKSIHWEPERLRSVIKGESMNFRKYDDVEGVTDLPAAIFYRELKEAYPECSFILTIRDEDSWYKSVRQHYDVSVPFNMRNEPEMLQEAKATQCYSYGSEHVSEFLYKKKFKDHNRNLLLEYPDTLVLDFFSGDGWEKLCSHVKKPIPKIIFPKLNKSNKFLI